MFEAMRAAIEELEIPVDGSALAEVLALRDRLDARINEAIGAFDAAQLFELDGAVSTVAWLQAHAGQSNRTAQRSTTTARRLRRCPTTRAAWTAGSLSSGQVEAVVANVRVRAADLWVVHEADVVPLLEPLGTRATATAMQDWAARAEGLLEDTEPAEPARSLHLSATLDGRRELSASLDAEGGELVATAVRLASTADLADEPPRGPAQRRADALVDLCRWFLDHQTGHPAGRHRPHVNLTVELDDLETRGQGRLLDGTRLDADSVQRLLCDAQVHRVLRARSSILDYGHGRRSIPPPLYQALLVRDAGCRFPGCDRPGAWCHGHHIRHWIHGGPTRLDNLVLLCGRHHHLVHKPRWQLELRLDATVEVTTPDGRTLRGRPPPDTG